MYLFSVFTSVKWLHEVSIFLVIEKRDAPKFIWSNYKVKFSYNKQYDKKRNAFVQKQLCIKTAHVRLLQLCLWLIS